MTCAQSGDELRRHDYFDLDGGPVSLAGASPA